MSMQARDDGSTQNLSVVQRVGAALRSGTIVDAADAFEPEVIWHYFNAKLPDLAGDYVGVSGIEHFFTQLAARTKGTFTVEPVSAHEIGQELVVTHGRVALVLNERAIRTDVLVVWRLRGRRVAEVWDIPATHTASIDDG